MTTTIEIIKNELKQNEIPFTGVYSKVPEMILSAVNNIKHFGPESISKRNLGKGVKRIALELAEKDTREAKLINGKTILR